jgi:signal transduction histidine kinase
MEHRERLICAVQLATRKLASTGVFDDLLREVLSICVEAVGATGGTIYLHDAASRRLIFRHVLPAEVESRLPAKDIADTFGTAGRAFQSHETICRVFPPKPRDAWNQFEIATGVAVESIVATPLIMEDETPIGVVQLLNKYDGEFNEIDCAVLNTIASVAAMAFANARLTEESARASTLLGMGRVGHDIGNLAAALVSNVNLSEFAFARMISELGDVADQGNINRYIQVLEPTLADLKGSTDRIVRYARLISDMSAGRTLRPNMICGPLSPTIREAAEHFEGEGRAQHVAIRIETDDEAPPVRHDDLYVYRIVQNLVGNGIKAVRETIPIAIDLAENSIFGEVFVRYCFGSEGHVLEVRDTGPGIDDRTIERILSGNARSQWERASGSGWGTKIVLELSSVHHARVSIDSVLGVGTTFRVVFPPDGDCG